MRVPLLLVIAIGAILFAAGCGGGERDDRRAALGSKTKPKNLPVGQDVSAADAPDRSAQPRDRADSDQVEALNSMQRRIARRAARSNDSFASYVDTETGKIVLATDASQSTVSQVTDDPDPQKADELDNATVKRTTIRDVFHRRDDVPAFWGGAGITAAGGTCSSGYAARNGSGTVFSVTAGHCWANGTTVRTESGARTYGTVSNRRLPTVTGGRMDVELLGGQSYAGRIFTGGVTSTSSAPVVAAGAAFAGFNNYCHSSRTTGQSCGHTATSTNGQVCTASGCKSPVIVFTGGNMIQGGDSGGTFYARDGNGGVWIRGNTIASGGGTDYAQPWTTISQTFGLTIVTG